MTEAAAAVPTRIRPAAPVPSAAKDILRLLLLCAVMYGAGLGRYALNNPDEGRYAEIPREMLAQHDYVTPRLNGVKYFEKPPLVYWFVAGCLRVFGPGEAAARATPAVFGALGVVLLYAAARRMHGREAAWWSAVILATNLLYFAHARILLIDMVVTVLMSAVLFCFLLGINTHPGVRRCRLFHGLYAAAALATLAKGLIGFLLPGAVMFLWLLLFNQWHRLRPFHLPAGLVIFGAIVLPWHVLVAQRNPEWANFYFVHEHWLRYTTTTHGRYEPWWYFVPVVVLGFFPWTGFIWSALRRAAAGGGEQRQERADDWFPLLWAGFILLFFSASQSKLVPYVLPLFPPLAWMTGRLVAELRAGRDPAAWRGPLGVSAGLVVGLGLALAVVVTKPGIIKTPEMLAQLQPLAWPAAVVLVAGGLISLWLLKRRRPLQALTAVLGASAMLGYTLVLASPIVAHPGTKSLAEIVAREADADDIVLHYHEFFHDFTYYARCTVGTVAAEGELEVFLDTEAQRSGRFLAEADLQPLWTSRTQVYLVVRRRELPELEKHAWFKARVLGEEPSHLLLSNHY